VLQAIAIFGGARVDCAAERLVRGASLDESGRLLSTVRAETVAAGDCGLAHCGVVTARQQS